MVAAWKDTLGKHAMVSYMMKKKTEAVSLISCGNMYHLKYHYQKIGNVIELILFSTKMLLICFCKCKKKKKKTGKGIKSNLNHVK